MGQNSLGEFIRARRDLLSPAEVGLAGPRSLRTTGLRREDLATLAGISVDYLSRLEQGRERNPSHRVISALVEVLRLDTEAAQHLHRLAHPPLVADALGAHEVSPELGRMVAAWQDSPAMVVGPELDILASNPLAAAVYAPARSQSNALLFVFLDPQAREFFVDWEMVARRAVAALHAGFDPRYGASARRQAIVQRLRAESADFARMWAKYEVRQTKYETMRIRHPEVGELEFSYHTLRVNEAPGQLLKVYQAEPGSLTEKALRELA